METAGVTTKITKSNSTPTPIRKVKDQPLQRIPINSTGSTLTADTHQWYRRNHSKFGIELHFVDSVRC